LTIRVGVALGRTYDGKWAATTEADTRWTGERPSGSILSSHRHLAESSLVTALRRLNSPH